MRVRIPPGMHGSNIFCFDQLLYKHHTKENTINSIVGYQKKVARLAQMVERMTLNHVVVGSIPTVGVITHYFLIYK